jgi:hypothetical protein
MAAYRDSHTWTSLSWTCCGIEIEREGDRERKNREREREREREI